jgi:CDP-glucose 4,6-dehydratase
MGATLHYLVTGHTGFKGAWLVLLLNRLGHQVSGISLDPETGSLFEAASLSELMVNDVRLDIRDAAALAHAVADIGADVLIHLAAQPLVRRSYRDPRETFETNVNGTLNILESSQASESIRARVIITTDKVYKNVNRAEGYLEDEPLGGDDPYSSSKAMADLLTQSWVKSFPAMPTAIARAGNVIGGGDVCEDRLIPDAIRAFSAGNPLHIRYPDAVRPWQHVLDCVNGYVRLADALVAGEGLGEWNFGPGTESFVRVGDVVESASRMWGNGASVVVDEGEHLHEANLLALNSAKAEAHLDWSNKLRYPESLKWTLDWERDIFDGVDARSATEAQIEEFLKRD